MLADLQKQLGIDATIGVQFVIFLGFYLWMRFVFFGPFLRLIDARYSSTQGLRDRASELELDADEKEKRYAERVAQARKNAAAEREKILAAARAKSTEAIDSARKAAKESIESSRSKEESEAKNSLSSLSSQISQLRDLFVDKLTNSKMGL